MQHELKQVEIHLKLTDKEGIFSKESIDTPEKAVSLMAPVLAKLDREEVCVVNLDSRGCPINYNVVSIGIINASLVAGRELYKSAILSNAASLIMVHNHPSSQLHVSSMDREVTEKMMYAGILLDIDFLDHVIVAGGTGEILSLRERYPYLFNKSSYSNQIAHVTDRVREEIFYPKVTPMDYEILQIKRPSNGAPYQYMGMDYVKMRELLVKAEDYESVYKSKLKPGESLDTLYEYLNMYHPPGFTGHSLSVSDVIVLETETEKQAFYVDSVGFSEVKDFFTERFPRTTSELQIISEFRKKTDRFFRPIDRKSAKEIETEVRNYLYEKMWEDNIPMQLGEVMLYGSRCRGIEKEDSDIDIVVEYKGVPREDDLFNLFHEDDFYIGNCKVDMNPIKEEKSGNIAEFLQRATYYMEQDLVFSIANRYITIQSATEGYEYTIYGDDFQEMDGGVYDNPDISIYEAIDEIVDDLKKQMDTNEVKGSIESSSVLVPLNGDEFEETLEKHNYVPPKITFTVAECGEFHQMGKMPIELAERICYQEEYGNQDVAPAVIMARQEMQEEQEKKTDKIYQRKR